MECSKCRLVKDPSCFYATGKVCKDCKRNYSRTYRRSRTVDARSCTTADDASVRSVDDLMHGTEDAIMERLQKIEADVAESKERVCREMDSMKAYFHLTVRAILDSLQKIDKSLDGILRQQHFCGLNSHPLTDLG